MSGSLQGGHTVPGASAGPSDERDRHFHETVPPPVAGARFTLLPMLPLAATEPRHRHIALGVTGLVAAITAVVLPVARVQGPALAGFVPSYQTAVFLFYALAGAHMVAHARRTGLVPLLFAAAGSIFSACILIAQMFSFPIWGPTQLIGSSPATTSWLWTFWHLGPSIFTLGYIASWRPFDRSPPIDRPAMDRASAIAVLGAVSLAALAIATSVWALPWLPEIVTGDDYRKLTTSGVGPAVLALTLVSLTLLIWRTRCRSLIELCMALALALLALDDVPTLIGASRLSVGWYVGRAEAALSAAILLAFYLAEFDRRIADVSKLALALSLENQSLDHAMHETTEANATLSMLVREDSLTLLANRRSFDQVLEQEWRRARRDQLPLTLLMIDVDYFKQFNDTLGHPAGDACLRHVGTLLRDIAQRPADLAARYGGEEFALLMPGSTAEQGRRSAEKLREFLRMVPVLHPKAPAGRVTVSIGIACIVPERNDHNHMFLIELADRALYRAKRNGRDQAAIAVENEEIGSIL